MKIGNIVVWDADVGIVIRRSQNALHKIWFICWSERGDVSSYYEHTILYHMEVICEGR